jgi:uncharacterized protein (TIGR03032 family)
MEQTATPQAAAEAETKPERKPGFETSPGFVAWLMRHNVSLACSSYQTGRLLLIGARRGGGVAVTRAQFPGAMGLAAFSQRIYLAGRAAIWRLENTLRPDTLVEDRYDRLFVPRNAQITGNLLVHEIAVEPSGRIVFVNTRYSCLATLSTTHAFRPLWRPAFVSRLAPEDRCHLNGLAMDGGRLRYATACAASDIVDGWRERRPDGGVLIDVATDRIVADGLSMPHSPRLHAGAVWLLNSGSGHLLRIDPQSGRREAVAFCPGFLRGLAFIDDFAVVTLSLPRYGRFQGLALDGELTQRQAAAWCGLMVIDTRSGDIVEWLRLDGEMELFDVGAVPLARCPLALAPDSPDLQEAITLEDAPIAAKPRDSGAADESRGRARSA